MIRTTTAASADRVVALTAREAVPRVLASVLVTLDLVRARRLHHPRDRLGTVLLFGDGSRACVYRETRRDDGLAAEPVTLVVGFVLRGVHGPAHRAFRLESWLNTPLFAGFPGFTSKLWLAHDAHGVYRGVYEWDGAERAADYVRALGWVLGLVCVPGSVCAHLVPGRRDALVDAANDGAPAPGDRPERSTPLWWLPTSAGAVRAGAVRSGAQRAA